MMSLRPYALIAWTIAASMSLIVTSANAQQRLPMKQHRTSDAPFLSPRQAVEAMSIPEGFEVSIFASEPTLAEPIAFCFDPRGRLWVVENLNYRTRREHTDEKVSRIQILEDTDSDGVFDERKIFKDDLTFTSGIAVGFGGVYLGSPPNLMFIPDADGDDVPDGPAEVLLDGWGINDRHETLNSFIWGPDGWLYGCHGVFTQSKVGTPGCDDSQRQFIDGGIWRFHPVTKKYEVFARGLSNPWGFDFDRHGQGFATCCVIPHLFHIVQGGVYHKQSRPHINPYIYDDIKTIRDHTHLSAHGGARFYLADAFPAEYRDRLFMCNIHEHAVLTDVMERRGSSFVGKHGDDFMPTNDLAWVGFSVEIGPEGGVYLLDWHDTDVCGNAINFPDSGRVYRIMPQGTDPIERPNLPQLSDRQLAELQTHPNDWYVRHARVLLHHRAVNETLDRDAVSEVLAKQFYTAESSKYRLRALWSQYLTQTINQNDLIELLDHTDEYVRAWSVRLLCDDSPVDAFFLHAATSADCPVDDRVMQHFLRLASEDPSPVVRLFLASAVTRFPFDDRWDMLHALTQHTDDAKDPNLERMYWFALEPMVPKWPQKSLQLAIDCRLPKIQEFVARRLATGDRIASGGEDWQAVIAKVAPKFDARHVGEGGIVFHSSFRNQTAMQTHPESRKRPCRLIRDFKIPADKQTRLKMSVSHHPHGDWQLRVVVNGDVVKETVVGPKTVGSNEWLEIDVDLTAYAGQDVRLMLENWANGWNNEWAYWNHVVVISR